MGVSMSINATNPTIQKHFDQLFSEILIEQQKINKIKSADEDKKEITKDLLNSFNNYRGRGFFFNYLSSGKGHGPFTQVVDGSVKYDLINGIGVNLLGHSHPLMIKAHLEAATCDTIMCGNLLPYKEALDVTKAIVDQVKEKSNLRYFWFAGSGSFANDTAIKMIWQKRAPRYKILAFERAFAGRSIATQDITFNEAYREGMPKSLDVVHIPHFDQQNPQDSLKVTLKSLQDAWDKDPDNYACLMLELIQGEGGFIFGNKNYYEEIFKWAKKKNIPILIDEVQSFGRTHELFSFQMFGLDQYVDVVTIAKAFQACGVLYSEEFNPKPGLVAGTFNGSISALKMASKTIRFLTEGNFYGKEGRIKQLENKIISSLEDIKKSNSHIGYIGGVGTMIAFEVGKSTKEDTILFLKKLFENGVIAFMAGKDPVRVRFLLPLTITNDHIDEIMNIISKTLNEVF